MKVLFLDIDGVLNSRKFITVYEIYGVAIDPTRMVLLKEIIDKTEAKIVLTSSWRNFWEKDAEECKSAGREINRIFGKFGLSVYDKTPVLEDAREDEIAAWLESRTDVESFAVLDDMFLDAEFLRGHFAKTSDYINGLDEDNVKMLLRFYLGRFERRRF